MLWPLLEFKLGFFPIFQISIHLSQVQEFVFDQPDGYVELATSGVSAWILPHFPDFHLFKPGPRVVFDQPVDYVEGTTFGIPAWISPRFPDFYPFRAGPGVAFNQPDGNVELATHGVSAKWNLSPFPDSHPFKLFLIALLELKKLLNSIRDLCFGIGI